MTVLAADSADIPKPSLEKLCTGFVFLNARFQVQSVHSSAKTSLTHLLPAPSSCLLITHISPQTISFLASNFPKTRPPPRRWPPPARAITKISPPTATAKSRSNGLAGEISSMPPENLGREASASLGRRDREGGKMEKLLLVDDPGCFDNS